MNKYSDTLHWSDKYTPLHELINKWDIFTEFWEASIDVNNVLKTTLTCPKRAGIQIETST